MITSKYSKEEMERRRQESIEARQIIAEERSLDSFYAENGPCCAGCDNWRYDNPYMGECAKSNLMAGRDRISLLGYKLYTGPLPSAGHAMTRRGYLCENFHDSDLPNVDIT